MKTNSPQIENTIKEILLKDYSLEVITSEFIPVGEESYGYKVTTEDAKKYFAKYTTNLDAIRTFANSQDLFKILSNFEFFVGPLRVGDTYSISFLEGIVVVYPYINGNVIDMGNSKFDKDLIDQLTSIMAIIHNTDTTNLGVPVELFQNNYAERFDLVLNKLEKGNAHPQLSELILREKDTINGKVSSYNQLAEKLKSQDLEMVLTHGDITGLNMMKEGDKIILLDWDGVRLAPKERDLAFLIDNPHFSVDDYLRLVNRASWDSDIVDYYNQNWGLESIIQNAENILDGKITSEHIDEYIEEIGESI